MLALIVSTAILIPSWNGSKSQAKAATGGVQSAFNAIPFPTYQFASWQGNGIGLPANDALVQQELTATGSMMWPWNAFTYGNTGWCNNANTTTSQILSSTLGAENTTNVRFITSYEIPFLLQIPLDGYGQCYGWAENVLARYPDLATFNSSAQRIDNAKYASVRVDDLNFSKQIYSDLVNQKNNLVQASPSMLSYWSGLYTSSIGSDLGAYGAWGDLGGQGIMMENSSVMLFAESPQCLNNEVNSSFGSCQYLRLASEGLATSTGGHPCCSTSVIYNQLIHPLHDNSLKGGQFSDWSNYEFLLGITYAMYNFTTRYSGIISHPFILSPGGRVQDVIPSSQYPYPYNSTYIESLNLLTRFISYPSADSENGGKPSIATESADLLNCWSNKNPNGLVGEYGNVYNNKALSGIVEANLGAFLAQGSDSPSYTVPSIQMDMYYAAACAATSIMEISSVVYQPSGLAWPTMTEFGTVLDRMQNVGSNQFTNPAFNASSAPIHVNANGGMNLFGTNVTLIGGVGKPLLAWFYTNSSSGDTASIRLTPSLYHLSSRCIAISVLTWSVVGRCDGNSLSLSIAIPDRGWNPVYVINDTATDLSPLYENLDLQSLSTSTSSATYAMGGPDHFSTWLVIDSSSPVSSVTTTTGGALQEYPSLSLLNRTTIGMQWIGGVWENLTQSGWFYDSTNSLLYVHFPMGVDTTVKVQQSLASSSTSTSVPSTSSMVSSSSASSSSFSSTSSSYRSASSSSSIVTSSASSARTSTSYSISSSTVIPLITRSTSTSTKTTSQPFTFHVELSQSGTSVIAGGSVQAAASVSPGTGHPQVVGLTASGLPPGVSVSFSPPAGTVGFVSDMVLSTSPSAPGGTYTLVVTGTSGPITSSATFQLVIYPGPPAVYQVSLGSATGGTTSPGSGTYSYAVGQTETVTALPTPGWSLEEWLVNGMNAGNGTLLTFNVDQNMQISPVFADTVTPSTQAASVAFLSSNANASSVSIDGTQYSLPVSLSLKAGSSHTISAVDVIPLSGSSNLVFEDWHGGVNATSPTVSFTAEPGMTLVAQYQASYLARFAFVDPAGNPVTPLNATLLGPSGFVTVSESNPSAWLDAGDRYSLVGAEIGGTSVPAVLQNLGVVTASRPGTFTIPLSLYPVTIGVVDVFKQPLSGSTVTLTTEGGQVYTQVTGADGVATFKDVPMGWYQATYAYMGVSGTLGSQSTGPQASTVTLVLSYPLVALAAVFIAGFAVTIVRLRRRSPKQVLDDEFYS